MRNIFKLKIVNFFFVKKQFLAKCVVGASLETSGEEEGAGEEEKEKKEKNTYKIYGTIKNEKEYKKQDFITEIIKVVNLV